MPTIKNLINTSVDDCKSSLEHITDLDFLQELHGAVLSLGGHPSRLRIVAARIRKVKMGMDTTAKN